MSKAIESNTVQTSSTLEDVLAGLNRGTFGVVFVVDGDRKLQGIFTDGDVRRSLLAGAKLSDKAADCMNREVTIGSVYDSRDQNLARLSDRVRFLPLVDEHGVLLDFISWSQVRQTPVMEPNLSGNELRYLTDCITSGWISSQGRYVQQFEEQFNEYLGTEFAVTTSSGTTALHLGLLALGVGPGDEVIVPNLTFGASANAVIHAGATPVFADVDRSHWTLSPASFGAAITPRTKAVMPVHIYGHPCDMDPLLEIAGKHNISVIEDCAESLGAEYKGQLVGSFGDLACFSFFSNKLITTGEGGMIVGKDLQHEEAIRLFRDHGMRREKRYWHEVAGFNYRMTNLQAAIGVAQLERIHGFVRQREDLAGWYRNQFHDLHGITHPVQMDWAKNVYWLYSILIEEEKLGITRDLLIKELLKQGIQSRPFFYPLRGQPAYGRNGPDCPVSEEVAAKGISLPSSVNLSELEVSRIVKAFRRIVSTTSRLYRDQRLISSNTKKREA